MKGARWKYILPSVMLALALACHVYDPHEYRLTALRDGATSNLYYFGQHSPAWSGRISKGVNFPALVLAYPFRSATQLVYVHGDLDRILIMISPADLSFFCCVVLFWFCFGWAIDRGGLPERVGSLALGLVFGLLMGAYAAEMVVSKWLPVRIIGGFGVA